MSPTGQRRLHRAACALWILALALLVAGSLVGSHGAAGAIPDWPLSYGQLIPRPDWPANAGLAATHRLLAATFALAVLGFAWACRHHPSRRVRRLAPVTALAVFLQIGLGGVVVLLFRPPWWTAAHTLLAQLTVATIGLLAWATAGHEAGTSPLRARHRRMARVVAALATLQVVLGALTRHPPTPGWRIPVLGAHVAVAFAVVTAAAVVVAVLGRDAQGRLQSAGYALVMTTWVQIIVGLALMLVAPDPFVDAWPPPAHFPAFHAVHVPLAAIVLTLTWGIAAETGRRARVDPEGRPSDGVSR